MKIGIITQFNKSTNYGGVLQAYALTKKLEKIGCSAEQISYVANLKNINYIADSKARIKRKLTLKRCINAVKSRLIRLGLKFQINDNKKRAEKKQKCFKML